MTVIPSTGPATPGAYEGTNLLSFTNGHSITTMTVTAEVAVTPGTTYNSQYNSFPGRALSQSESGTSGWLTYTPTMVAGQTIPANANAYIRIQYYGTATVHPSSGDT